MSAHATTSRLNWGINLRESSVQEDELRQALLDVNGDDVDALVQVGIKLSIVRLADEAERWLGKPVIAINSAIWWMALRENGMTHTIEGCGRSLTGVLSS